MNKKRESDMFDIMFANPQTTMEQASNIVQARQRRRQAKRLIAIVAILLLAAICIAPSLLGG